MKQQIQCPNCQTPYLADVERIIDVGRQPSLKQMLLSGRLNMAVCPNCNAGIQLATPMLYHDPEHELFMTFVPMELNLPHVEQEKLIGELVREVMDNTPPEQRRAYMLTPLTIIKYQTFMEKILETEGITPEMIEQQRQQAQLLQDFARADKETTQRLLKENADKIDETFLAMLESSLQQLLQTNEEQQILSLTNLQAHLYRNTEVGQRLQRQKIALQKFQKEAKDQGGLSPALMVKHIVNNQDDEQIVASIGQMAQAGLSYQFFQAFSHIIESKAKQGDVEGVRKLEKHRAALLQIQETAEKARREALEEASHVLHAILNAPDSRQAVLENIGLIDEAVMFVLNNTLAQAEQIGNQEQADRLRGLQQIISEEMESNLPPELQLINELASLQTTAQQSAFLDANPNLLAPEMVEMLKLLERQSGDAGDTEFSERMGQIAGIIESRLAT